MQYLFNRMVAGLVLCLLCVPVIAQERLVLNGAYQYLKLNSPVYIGGLYLSERSSDLDDLLSDKDAKMMRIVVTADVWRSNSWSRHWRDAIAVNNRADAENGRVYKALGAFTEMVPGRLERDDEVVISYENGTTSIRLNGELAVTAETVQVFNYLLNTWIGDVPPSSAFRSAILNGAAQADKEEGNEFAQILNAHTVPSSRATVFSQWRARAQQQKLQEQQRAEEAARKAAEERAREEREAQEAARRLAAIKESQKKKNGQSNKDDAKVQKELEAALKAKQQRDEQRFLSELVTYQIQRYINKHTRYPMWAEKFGEEGLVNVSFTLGPGRNVTFAETAENDSMLVQEVKAQIRNSLDSVSIPSSILDTPQQTAVSYLFSLRGESQSELSKPAVPEHLPGEADTSEESRDAIRDYYQKYVVKAVTNAIEYPDTARTLRQRGRLTAQFGVNSWGEVESFSLTGRSRHKLLNEALESAVMESAPFKPFPLEIFNQPAVQVTIDHTFR